MWQSWKSHNQLSPNGVFTNKCDVCRKYHCHTSVIGVILVQTNVTFKMTIFEVSWLIGQITFSLEIFKLFNPELLISHERVRHLLMLLKRQFISLYLNNVETIFLVVRMFFLFAFLPFWLIANAWRWFRWEAPSSPSSSSSLHR